MTNRIAEADAVQDAYVRLIATILRRDEDSVRGRLA